MDYESSATPDSTNGIRITKEAFMISAELKQDVLVAIEESPKICRMDGDIAELKGDVKVLKEDVRVLKEDVRVLKEDVKVLKEDVRVLKQDVVELKRDVAKLKDDVALLQRQMERMMALMEEFNTKLTLALEMLQHCVHMIPAVSKHDLQITKAKDDVHVTQTILSDHIQNQEIHVTPKRGRPRKTSKGTPEENL